MEVSVPLGEFVQVNEALRFRIRQGPQEDGVDHAEDGGVRADTEGKGEHGDGSEGGLLHELAQRVAKILKQCVHGFSPIRLSVR